MPPGMLPQASLGFMSRGVCCFRVFADVDKMVIVVVLDCLHRLVVYVRFLQRVLGSQGFSRVLAVALGEPGGNGFRSLFYCCTTATVVASATKIPTTTTVTAAAPADDSSLLRRCQGAFYLC